MGELIIHIDQETGAVLKVKQRLDAKDKRKLVEKPRDAVSFNVLKLIKNNVLGLTIKSDHKKHDKLKKIVKQLEAAEVEISKWCDSKEEYCTVTLPPLGNLYRDDPEIVRMLLEHRDTFQRFVPLPVELWEKKGNTVCTIECGGVLHECYH